MTDDQNSAALRSGTLFVLATTPNPAVACVQAEECLGRGPPEHAAYSGRPQDGPRLVVAELVDDGWPDRGTAVAANGSQRRVRMSGTSAAAGLQARKLAGLGPAPEL